VNSSLLGWDPGGLGPAAKVTSGSGDNLIGVKVSLCQQIQAGRMRPWLRLEGNCNQDAAECPSHGDRAIGDLSHVGLIGRAKEREGLS
jgi:hypothetical protein